MGRPIKKAWFAVKDGPVEGNLTLETTAGNEEIIKQTGTGVYDVASGRVKLMDSVPAIAADPDNGIVGDARLQHDGKAVSRVNQYVLSYFDGSPNAQWRDASANVVGTFTPGLDGGGVVVAAVAQEEPKTYSKPKKAYKAETKVESKSDDDCE